MDERVKNYISQQQQLQKEKILIASGLCYKVYRPDDEPEPYNPEYPLTEFCEETGEAGTQISYNKYYKMVPLDVSDDEYQKILELHQRSQLLYDIQDNHNKNEKTPRNTVSTLLRVVAVLVFISGLISGFIYAGTWYNGSLWGFNFWFAVLYWIAAAAISLIFVGLSEIIKLLHTMLHK